MTLLSQMSEIGVRFLPFIVYVRDKAVSLRSFFSSQEVAECEVSFSAVSLVGLLIMTRYLVRVNCLSSLQKKCWLYNKIFFFISFEVLATCQRYDHEPIIGMNDSIRILFKCFVVELSQTPHMHS